MVVFSAYGVVLRSYHKILLTFISVLLLKATNLKATNLKAIFTTEAQSAQREAFLLLKTTNLKAIFTTD